MKTVVVRNIKRTDADLVKRLGALGVATAHEGEDGCAEGGRVMESKPSPYHSPRTLVTVNQDDDIDPTTRAWVSWCSRSMTKCSATHGPSSGRSGRWTCSRSTA